VLKLFLWLRYLRKKKIVILCIVAVALSVSLLLVVDSFFTGLIDGLKNSLAAESGDAVAYIYGKPIPQYNAFLGRLEHLEEVDAAAPICTGGGLLWLESGDVREAGIKGIDIEKDSKFINWKNCLLRQKEQVSPLNFTVPGYPDANGVWVGVNIIAEPNERTDKYDVEEIRKLIGKKVVLTTEGFGRKRKVIPLRISDIAFTDTIWGDRTLYVPFEYLFEIQTGITEGKYANFFKLKLNKNYSKKTMQSAVFSVWEKFARENLGWADDDISRMHIDYEEEHSYFHELRKQMAILLLIFGVICSVVILLVFCIFYMIVETKLKDIAIIKSCGASSTTAALIFTGFGGCIGLTGSGLGIIIGYIIVKNVNILEGWVRVITGIKLWRRSSYLLNYIPNQLNWPDILPITLAAVAGCCAGALIPAIVAAKTRPVDILRYE